MHGVGEAPILFCKVLSVNKMTCRRHLISLVLADA